MNIETVVAWGEALGSIAILVTLIYLAIQTKQNSRAIKANTRQEISAANQAFAFQMIDNPDLTLLQYKAKFTEAEKIRLSTVLLAFCRMRENNWLQYKNGVLDAKTWSVYRRSISHILASKQSRKWWRYIAEKRGEFDPEFTAMVSEYIKDTPVLDKSPMVQAFDD